MNATRSFRHENYELVCSAKAIDRGKFLPTLFIAKHVWPTRPREIAVLRGDHTTEQSAIEAAYRQGLDWVLNYG